MRSGHQWLSLLSNMTLKSRLMLQWYCNFGHCDIIAFISITIAIIISLQMDTLSESQKKQFVTSCPTRVYAYEEQHRVVVVEDSVGCMFCEECIRKAELFEVTDLVSIGTKPGRFLFKVETTGVMPPEQIVFSALKTLASKLQILDEELMQNAA